MSLNDCSDAPFPSVEAFITRCLDLADGDGSYAADTLRGIADTVERSGAITERQLQAVENIEAGAKKTTRRYEGYQHPWRRR